MDRVQFRRAVEAFPTGDALVIDPYVNDVSLRDLAQAAELPFVAATGNASRAGGHAGLRAVSTICWPSRHFLGRPTLTWFDAEHTILLGCVCGDAGCAPVAAEVVVDRATVTWRHFRARNVRDLSGLGPFHFPVDHYLAALRATAIPS